MPVPAYILFPLEEFCHNELINSLSSEFVIETTERENEDGDATSQHVFTKSSEILQIAIEHPLLVLIFRDSNILYMSFSLLNSVRSTILDSKATKEATDRVQFVHNLFRNFVHFLVNHCRDYSCFFEPILKVLGTISERQNISKPFMSLVGRLTSEFAQEGDPEQLLRFIRGGGGQLILECLVMSCRQHNVFGSSLLDQNVNRIGQTRNLKPFSDSSYLVNFLPLATIRAVPSRHSAMELITSGPSRASTFHHVFLGNEQWVELHISLPYPILLCAIQLYQPIGLLHNGPSSLLVKVSPQGVLSSALPITPLIPTSGLSSIKVEFQNSLITQEIVLHLQKPFVTNNLALSHMHLLGLGYAAVPRLLVGGASQSDSGRKGEEHPRYV